MNFTKRPLVVIVPVAPRPRVLVEADDCDLVDFLTAVHGTNWHAIGNGTFKEAK